MGQEPIYSSLLQVKHSLLSRLSDLNLKQRTATESLLVLGVATLLIPRLPACVPHNRREVYRTKGMGHFFRRDLLDERVFRLLSLSGRGL